MQDVQRMAGLATVSLGASQALVPQTAARVFGLAELDGQATWLARLLGMSNIALGVAALDPATRDSTRTATRAVLAGNAAATVMGLSSGALSKRTGAMVLVFIGALAAADLASD